MQPHIDMFLVQTIARRFQRPQFAPLLLCLFVHPKLNVMLGTLEGVLILYVVNLQLLQGCVPACDEFLQLGILLSSVRYELSLGSTMLERASPLERVAVRGDGAWCAYHCDAHIWFKLLEVAHILVGGLGNSLVLPEKLRYHCDAYYLGVARVDAAL